MEYINKIIAGNSKDVLRQIPDGVIRCCVTSPPYYGLRDYGHVEQIGLEETPEQYIKNLVEGVFEEVKRVLTPDGTLWVNIGDSYAAGPKSRTSEQACRKSNLAGGKGTQISCANQINKIVGDLKPKDLIGIPWMLAFALRSSGWYLRQEIIWNKPNPMPESVTDRCTKAHEQIFLLSKSSRYFYDAEAIKTDSLDAEADIKRFARQDWDNKNTPDRLRNGIRPRSTFGNINGELDRLHSGNPYFGLEKANRRSVWTINTKPYPEAHFATFPPELPELCIKAGSESGDIILDPFSGAGTTAMVASKLGRKYFGIELNEKYVQITNKRLNKELGLFMPDQNIKA